MNLILRLLRVILSALFKPRVGLLDGAELSFRVLPTDLDINRHMTNARSLSAWNESEKPLSAAN